MDILPKLPLTWIEAVAEHKDVAKVLDHEEGELVIEGGPGNDELMNSGYWGRAHPKFRRLSPSGNRSTRVSSGGVDVEWHVTVRARMNTM